MTDRNISYQNSGVNGVPAFEVLDNFVDSNLVAGAEPPIARPNRILLASSLTLKQFTVVGLDASGHLTPAVYNATLASGVKPVGVLMQAATSGASNSTVYGEVSLGGNFNVGSDDAGSDSPLVWDASFDTLAKKTTWAGLVGNPNLLFRSRSKLGAS